MSPARVDCVATSRGYRDTGEAKSGVLRQKQVSRAGTSNYIPQILWGVITCPCHWSCFWHNTPQMMCTLHILMPRQNGRQFAEDIFKRVFLNENFRTLIEISLKFVRKVQINNKQHRFMKYWRWLATSHYLTNDRLAYWRIYVSPRLNGKFRQW